MPFTPFHLGPASWIGLLLFRFLDFPALLVSSVIVDLEPFAVLVFNLDRPLHGFFHSFLGGSIAAILTAAAIYFLKGKINKLMVVFRLGQKSSFKKILAASFFGVYFHIVLDSFLYTDIRPFYPLHSNPLYGLVSSTDVYLFSGLSFVLGIALYAFLLKGNKIPTTATP